MSLSVWRRSILSSRDTGKLLRLEIREMHLKDKVAVVTGAASGIGKEIARTLNAGEARGLRGSSAPEAHCAPGRLLRNANADCQVCGEFTIPRCEVPRTRSYWPCPTRSIDGAPASTALLEKSCALPSRSWAGTAGRWPSCA